MFERQRSEMGRAECMGGRAEVEDVEKLAEEEMKKARTEDLVHA